MRSLVVYYTERLRISETKFKNLNEVELESCRKLLKCILESDIPTTICNKPEFGKRYYIEFDNPFYDTDRYYESINGKRIDDIPVMKCIGISDKFGRIFLQNIWESNEPAFIQYKEGKTKQTKSGKTYSIKECWSLTRKNFKCYKSNGIKISGVYGASLNVRKVVDLSDIVNEEVSKFRDDMYDLECRAKKVRSTTTLSESNNEYACYGCLNAWKYIPDIVNEAYNDNNAEWRIVRIGNHYKEAYCDTYRIFYCINSI